MDMQIFLKFLTSRFIDKVQCLMTRQVFLRVLDFKQDRFILLFIHDDQVKFVRPS